MKRINVFNKNFTHRRITKEECKTFELFFTWGKNHKSNITNLFPEFEKNFILQVIHDFDIIKKNSKNFIRMK